MSGLVQISTLNCVFASLTHPMSRIPFRFCPSVGMFDVVCNRWGMHTPCCLSVFRCVPEVGLSVDPHVRPFDYSAVSRPSTNPRKGPDQGCLFRNLILSGGLESCAGYPQAPGDAWFLASESTTYVERENDHASPVLQFLLH